MRRAMVRMPDYEAFKKKQKVRRLLSTRNLFILCLVAVACYWVTRPERRGRVDRDTSRIESFEFPGVCETALGQGANRILVSLLSVEPESDRAGVTAVLGVKVCNPSENDVTVSDLSFRYVPSNKTSPGFTWALEEKIIGGGYCDEYAVKSPPLGELVAFSGQSGTIELRGMGAPATIVQLPGCSGRAVAHAAPTAPPPSPTPAATPEPTVPPDCVDDRWEPSGGNDEEATALRLKDGTWEFRLCPRAELVGQPFSDVDWFYVDYSPRVGGGSSIVLSVPPESSKFLENTPLEVDVLWELEDNGGRRKLVPSVSMKLTMKNRTDTKNLGSWELGQPNKQRRVYLRAVLDPRIPCGHHGVTYSIELKGMMSAPATPTPKPTPTRVPPTPTPRASKVGGMHLDTGLFARKSMVMEVKDGSPALEVKGRAVTVVKGEDLSKALRNVRIEKKELSLLLSLQGDPVYLRLTYPEGTAFLVPFIQERDKSVPLHFPSDVKLVEERVSEPGRPFQYEVACGAREKVWASFFYVTGGDIPRLVVTRVR